MARRRFGREERHGTSARSNTPTARYATRSAPRPRGAVSSSGLSRRRPTRRARTRRTHRPPRAPGPRRGSLTAAANARSHACAAPPQPPWASGGRVIPARCQSGGTAAARLRESAATTASASVQSTAPPRCESPPSQFSRAAWPPPPPGAATAGGGLRRLRPRARHVGLARRACRSPRLLDFDGHAAPRGATRGGVRFLASAGDVGARCRGAARPAGPCMGLVVSC
jgi:hypothetical protein